jgi:hypothetical protein
MAAVARAYWTSLFNLEAIKSRNKATAAPTAAVKAPFFLPTVVRGMYVCMCIYIYILYTYIYIYTYMYTYYVCIY